MFAVRTLGVQGCLVSISVVRLKNSVNHSGWRLVDRHACATYPARLLVLSRGYSGKDRRLETRDVQNAWMRVYTLQLTSLHTRAWCMTVFMATTSTFDAIRPLHSQLEGRAGHTAQCAPCILGPLPAPAFMQLLYTGFFMNRRSCMLNSGLCSFVAELWL